ncbi:hypothetical protein NR798_30535 [Archangium gephyra]|uniref:hypothetical protein n=1 Tax=Archangium gephyra TaxID=48 RepID=UPI0035D4B3F6
MMKKLLSVCLLSSALLAGCGGEKNEADVEGCEHLQEGPGAAVSASASATGTLPAVSNDHKRYDISLPAGNGGNVGSVSFAAAEASDYVFFLGSNVTLKVTNSSGETVSFEESATSSTECTNVKGRYVAPLQVGSYTLTFGPTSESSVSLVIEETAHADEH